MGPRKTKVKAQAKTAAERPQLRSYDSGYEHSPQHWLELQKRIGEDDRERPAARRAQAG